AEVLEVSDRLIAMRNGRIVWREAASRASIADMIEAMGGPGTGTPVDRRPDRESKPAGDRLLTLSDGFLGAGQTPVDLHRGEIIGLAGLEGSGQKSLLQTLYSAPGKLGLKADARVRYI